MDDLFTWLADVAPQPPEELASGALLLRGHATAAAPALLATVAAIATVAPFRRMDTPHGRMSVETTSCGALGWVSDAHGYRYAARDPLSGLPWPALPADLLAAARGAAAAAGWPEFVPDACLINRYAPGARMGLHQDSGETSFAHPVVSLSFGLPAVFLFGGARRDDPTRAVTLRHGDAVVWGGPARMAHHAIRPLKPGTHALTGAWRCNLTFRVAG